MSRDALRRTQAALGYRYASDARADSASSGPFWPLVKAGTDAGGADTDDAANP